MLGPDSAADWPAIGRDRYSVFTRFSYPGIRVVHGTRCDDVDTVGKVLGIRDLQDAETDKLREPEQTQ